MLEYLKPVKHVGQFPVVYVRSKHRSTLPWPQPATASGSVCYCHPGPGGGPASRFVPW